MTSDRSGPPREESHRDGLATTLKSVKAQLIAAWAQRVQQELANAPIPTVELVDHMPAFVDELIETAATTGERLPSGTAGLHGVERLRLGFDVDEVIREYGLLHECLIQAVSGTGHRLEAEEQRVIARAINRGIADAVSQYVSQRDAELERQASAHIGFIAHEVRNGLSVARMAYENMAREAGSGSAPERLGRSLRAVAEVVDNALTQSWLRMGVVPQVQPLHVRAFLEELVPDLAAGARERVVEQQIELPPALVISADPRLLRSALSNLVTNALKFSPAGSTVTVRASLTAERLVIDVADQCGGLPPGRAEELFSPLVQRHENRTGFGLGLAIVRQAAEAHGGTVKVRDVPGVGCVFSLDLPLVQDGVGSRSG
jgi:signal transduction histidine kinase